MGKIKHRYAILSFPFPPALLPFPSIFLPFLCVPSLSRVPSPNPAKGFGSIGQIPADKLFLVHSELIARAIAEEFR